MEWSIIRIRKSSTFGFGESCIQHYVRSGEIRVSNMSGLKNPSVAQSECLGPEPLQRHTKALNWVFVDGEV